MQQPLYGPKVQQVLFSIELGFNVIESCDPEIIWYWCLYRASNSKQKKLEYIVRFIIKTTENYA